MAKMNAVRRHVSCVLLLQLVVFSHGIWAANNEVKELSVEEVIEKWINMKDEMKNTVNYFLRMALPNVKEPLMTLNLSQQCKRDSEQLIAGIKKFEPWALRFLDSSGKMIDGIMFGTLISFGVYEECLDSVAMSEDNKTKEPFKGQYCSIDFKPELPADHQVTELKSALNKMNFSGSDQLIRNLPDYVRYFNFLSVRLGICVPSGCNLEDVDKLGKLIGDRFFVNAKAKRCKVKESSIEVPPIGIFTLCCYAAAVLLLVIGSSLDIYSKHKNIVYTSKLHRVLLAFSLITNFKRLINTDSRSQDLTCLNGIRFLSISWVILGHSYFLMSFQSMTGLIKVKDNFEDFAFQVVMNGIYSVETFFFMGGLLTSFLMIKKVKIEGMPFNIPLYIFHRIWRMMPTYIFVLLLAFLSDLTEFGPLYKDHVQQHAHGCYKNWWMNLLFINNFFNYNDICLRHSWYISCDFQLYLAALLILIPFIKSSMAGISLSVLGVLLSVNYSAVITYVKDYPPIPIMFQNLSNVGDYYIYFYGSPLVHLGPYCIGILAGYTLASKPKLQIPRKILVIGWCLAFICNVSVLYGSVKWFRGEKPLLAESIAYTALGRTGWSMGMAWMVICCATGHGGIVNYILSWPVFIPLGRLTFVAYLIHPFVQLLLLGNFTVLFPATQILGVWLYFGHLCLTFGTAFLGSMLLEAPFLALEKVILERRSKPSTEKAQDSLADKNCNAISMPRTFNEGIPAPDISKNCTIIENNGVISKL